MWIKINLQNKTHRTQGKINEGMLLPYAADKNKVLGALYKGGCPSGRRGLALNQVHQKRVSPNLTPPATLFQNLQNHRLVVTMLNKTTAKGESSVRQ